MSKGSKPRPVDPRKFAQNYEQIFRKKHDETINPHANDSNESKPSCQAARKNPKPNRKPAG